MMFVHVRPGGGVLKRREETRRLASSNRYANEEAGFLFYMHSAF